MNFAELLWVEKYFELLKLTILYFKQHFETKEIYFSILLTDKKKLFFPKCYRETNYVI